MLIFKKRSQSKIKLKIAIKLNKKKIFFFDIGSNLKKIKP